MPLGTRSARSITGWCCVRSPRPAATSCSAPRTAWATSACGLPCSIRGQARPFRRPGRRRTSLQDRTTRRHGCRSACRARSWPRPRAGLPTRPWRGSPPRSRGWQPPRYVALDSGRGMDYHRLRPQSVPHASPKRGVSQAADGIATIDLPGPVLDPEADADRVYQLLIEAMEAIRQAMVTIRNDLAKAVRAAALWYHEPTPRPPAPPPNRAPFLNHLPTLP